ncbi:MAG: hypothetical protein WD534_00490 [Phycisphaeraceae bacterium]
MGLKPVNLTVEAARVSPEAEALLRDADARIDQFIHRRRNDPLPAFVPSDARLSYTTLELIRDRHLAPDMTMCEWGSGFGVTACLATLLGYDACGIEIEPDLVDEAQDLANAHDLSTEFTHGSFIPDTGDHLAIDSGDFDTLATDRHSAYDEMGLDVEDFGLIYAYPWPGEEQTVERIFEAYAAVGALLVTYRGINHIHVHRKTAGRTKPYADHR